MNRILTGIALLALTTTASANLSLEFREGAPKDRFIVSNIGDCTLTDMAITIDFKDSAGKLIFDITNEGAGVEVFQPFEIESGSKFLTQTPDVVDGQTQITLNMTAFEAGKKIVASTDLDDTVGTREITVTASEFSGTVVNVTIDGNVYTTKMNDKPEAVVELNGC